LGKENKLMGEINKENVVDINTKLDPVKELRKIFPKDFNDKAMGVFQSFDQEKQKKIQEKVYKLIKAGNYAEASERFNELVLGKKNKTEAL
jgi:hypothetical protein